MLHRSIKWNWLGRYRKSYSQWNVWISAKPGFFALLILLMNAREAASAINIQVFERLFVAHLVYLPPEVTDLRLPDLWGGFRTVQSRYQRTSADLPCNGCFATIPVQARRFA